MITDQITIVGRIPNTKTAQLIPPKEHNISIEDNGKLFIAPAFAEAEIAFVDLRVPKDQVDDVITSIIEQINGLIE